MMVRETPGFHLSVQAGRLLIWCLAAMACLGGWLLTTPKPVFGPNDIGSSPGDPQLGRLVFLAASCGSCHATPGQPDSLVLGGGLALSSSFGVFRPPNISPDIADGIGSWTVEDFANALVAGISPDGRHYYPAFPYTSYTGMKIEDIKNLYAYLRTLPPVSGKAPPHDLWPPFRLRRAVGVWKLLFFDEVGKPQAITGDPALDRGSYLTETLAHCAECHSSRNIFAAIRPETRFAGGPDAEGTGFVPNITPTRLSTWTQTDISTMLATGQTPQDGHVGSAMVDVVANLSQLPQEDRDAIARYIKALPARQTPHP